MPFIIAPTADKGGLYRTLLVRALWSAFASALAEADEVFVVGYSLPRSDVTVRMLLTAAIAGSRKPVHTVTRRPDKRHYQRAFRGCSVDVMFDGDRAVEDLAAHLGGL